MPTKGSNRITVRFPEPLYSNILNFAKHQKESPSEVIRKAAWELLSRYRVNQKDEKP